jgi:hypothetical protein
MAVWGLTCGYFLKLENHMQRKSFLYADFRVLEKDGEGLKERVQRIADHPSGRRTIALPEKGRT